MSRSSAYAESGIDAIWPGVSAKEELRNLNRSFSIPMVGVPRRAQVSLAEYGNFGFKIACIPGIVGQAATLGMAELLEGFQRTGSDEEFWQKHSQAERWRRWFNSLGREEGEAFLNRIQDKSKKAKF